MSNDFFTYTVVLVVFHGSNDEVVKNECLGVAEDPKTWLWIKADTPRKTNPTVDRLQKYFFPEESNGRKRKWGKGGRAVRVASEAGTGDVKKVSEEHSFCSTTADRPGKFLDSI